VGSDGDENKQHKEFSVKEDAKKIIDDISARFAGPFREAYLATVGYYEAVIALEKATAELENANDAPEIASFSLVNRFLGENRANSCSKNEKLARAALLEAENRLQAANDALKK